jgi:Carboxypeptidase regulatory-like domain
LWRCAGIANFGDTFAMRLKWKRRVVAAGLFAASTTAALSGQRGAPPPPPPPTGTGFLAGQVIEVPSGRPIAGALVSIGAPGSGRGGLGPVLTDSQGRFFFANLPAAAVASFASKIGYTSLSGARRVELVAGGRITDLKIRLVKLATMAGAVRDDAGDPVVGNEMRVFRRTITDGQAAWRPLGLTRTDDRGEYRFGNLLPGTFVVCACGTDSIPFDRALLTSLAAQPMQLLGVAGRALSVGGDAAVLDSTLRTFAPTFFPSASTVGDSTRVILAAGEDRRGVDITTVPVHAVRVSGTISGSVSPLAARSVRLVRAGETDEAAMISGLAPVLVQPDGRFDFAGVPPGQYVLRVQHNIAAARGGGSPSGSAIMFLGARGSALTQPPPGSSVDPLLWAADPITVGQDHIQGLSIALRPGTPVRGRLQFVGASAQPTAQLLTKSLVILQRIAIDPAQVGFVPTALVAADGTFSILGAGPGRYILGAAMPGWPTLKSVEAGGVDITDTGLDVGSTEINDIVLTFTDARQAVIDGQLIDPSKAATEDLTALLFPADRQLWSRPVAARGRFRAAAIDSKGTFTLSNLPAGEYFLTVVPDEQVVDWQDAPRLEALVRQAQRIVLAAGDKQSITVKR